MKNYLIGLAAVSVSLLFSTGSGYAQTNLQQAEILQRLQSQQQNTGIQQELTTEQRDVKIPSVERNDEARAERTANIDKALSSAPVSDPNAVFGRNVFTSKSLSFEPNLNMATPVDYRLAAGDEIILDIWGASEIRYTVVITPEGTVKIPNAGVVSLSGLTVEEAEARLKQYLSNIYSQLDNEAGDQVQLRVSLGRIRSIKVNVLGEVLLPGTYTVPSLATVFNVLYMAGGVNDIGSLRDVKVYRNNRQVASVDVYDYLLSGDGSSNIRLQDNDVVMVPPYFNLVKVAGDVKREMVYELKKGETLSRLVEYAGGFQNSAYSDKIQVHRKTGDHFSINTVEKGDFDNFALQDGDLIEVLSSIKRYDNRVAISGAVWRPGDFELKDDTKTVSALIRQSGGLRGDAFTNRGQITRQKEDHTYEVIAFDVNALLNGSRDDIELKPEDFVYIPSIHDLKYKEYVIIRGEVNFNRDKFLDRSGINSDFASFLENTYTDSLSETNSISGKQFVVSSAPDNRGQNQDLSQNQDQNTGKNKTLSAEANNPVAEKFNFSDRLRYVKSKKNADTILYRANMTVEDAIILAGGLSDAASEAKITIARRISDPKATTVSKMMAQEFEFPISKDLKIDPAGASFVLQPYDEIYVRRSPAYQEQQSVTLNGEVVFSGDYPIVERSMRLSQLIEKAGGLTQYAYAEGANLKRRKTEDEIVQEQTMRDVARQKQGRDSLSTDMAKIEFYSNVGIDLKKALAKPNSVYDIVLQPGDIIQIPQFANTVKISGAVLYPTTTTFDGEQKLKKYIYRAGGYLQNSRKRPFIVYMNGQVAATRATFFGKRYPEIEPGCIVVVPLKNMNPNRMGLAEILSLTNSAMSTAAMVTAITRK